jgi:hypothetical protein
MNEWAVVLSIFSLIVSISALGLAGYAVIINLAMKNSTHKIQYVNPLADNEFNDHTGETLADEMGEAFGYPMPEKKKKEQQI